MADTWTKLNLYAIADFKREVQFIDSQHLKNGGSREPSEAIESGAAYFFQEVLFFICYSL